MSERKRKAISLEEKFEIISKRAKGEKSKDLMVEFGLSASTIATIVSNKVKIIAINYNIFFLSILFVSLCFFLFVFYVS